MSVEDDVARATTSLNREAITERRETVDSVDEGNFCLFERLYRAEMLRQAMATYLAHPPGVREKEAAKVLQREVALPLSNCSRASHRLTKLTTRQQDEDRRTAQMDLALWQFSHRVQ